MIDIKKAKEAFKEYVKNYDSNNKKVKLKIAHIERTSQIARKTAEYLELDNEDIKLAELIGLLHDIGRFEQIKQYDTFVDRISVDHGELGAKILFEDGLIRNFIEDDKYDNIIKTAIINHNRDPRKVDTEISTKELLHVKIIRDADKTDIMYILTFEDKEACYEKEDFYEEEMTDEIYTEFIEDRYINYQNIKTNVDEVVAHFAYIYDFNYEFGLKYIYQNDYIKKLYERFEFENQETQNRCNKIYQITQDYLKKQTADDMEINRKEAREEFDKYIEKFDITNSNIERKIFHSYRVAKICKEIAIRKNLKQEDIELAELIGLLHDIGRFEQYKRYQTFSDRKSIDHGDLAVEILKENNYIRKYVKSDKYDQIIYKAIINHNKYQIEDGLSIKEELFAKIIRDSDKIDILYEGTGIFWRENKELENDIITPEVLEQFMQEKTVRNENKKNQIDHLVGILSFIYDINYIESLKIIHQENYLNKIIERFNFKNEATKEIIKIIKTKANKYINK